MTAVEFIFEQLEEQGLIFLTTKTNEMTISISASDYLDIKRLAKEMEKKQIMYSYEFGLCDEYVIGSDKFYTFTYGSEENSELSEVAEDTSFDNPPKEENKEGFGKIRFTEDEWAELNNGSKGSDGEKLIS